MRRWRKSHAAALAVCLLLFGSACAQARGPWVVLNDCLLADNTSNDADSFHVRAGRKEYIFRLYFADAPETDASFPARVVEQAKYFGITPQQTVLLGSLAEKFTQQKLARPFTIRTCKQDAMGRSKKERFYAFVETSDGDLAELLIANGLARVHGRAATPEGISSPEREWRKLQRLEREAKVQHVGGWGAAFGRMTARLPAQPAKTGADSFEAFFHPDRVAPSMDADAEVSPTPAIMSERAKPATVFTPASGSVSATAGVKLDINSATSAELMNIRSIGPILAQRIIDARPFKSADDLRNVKGIGPKTYEKIRASFL